MLNHIASTSIDSMKTKANIYLLLQAYAMSLDNRNKVLAAKSLVRVFVSEDLLADSDVAAIEFEIWLHHLKEKGESVRVTLASLLWDTLTGSGKEAAMTLFLSRENQEGLSPVTLALLKCDWTGRDRAAYLKAVLSSLMAISESPSKMECLVKTFGLAKTNKDLKVATELQTEESASEFSETLTAFHLLLAVRLAAKDNTQSLTELKVWLCCADRRRSVLELLLRQDFVRSLYQPFDNELLSEFVVEVLRHQREGDQDTAAYYRDKLVEEIESRIFLPDDPADETARCLPEVWRSAFRTLAPSRGQLEGLLLRGLRHCSRQRPSKLGFVCLGEVMRAVADQRCLLTEDVETECKEMLPGVLVNGFVYIQLAASEFLKVYKSQVDGISEDQFEKLCSKVEVDDGGLVKGIIAESERLAAVLLKYFQRHIEIAFPKALENVPESVVLALKSAPASKKLIKCLTAQVSPRLSTYLYGHGRGNAAATELVRVLCEKYEIDLSGKLSGSDSTAAKGFDILKARFHIASKPVFKAEMVIEQVLWPSLDLCCNMLKNSEDAAAAATVSEFISEVCLTLSQNEGSVASNRERHANEWINYVRAILKNCLKATAADAFRAKHIHALSAACCLLYSRDGGDGEEAAFIYSLVFGHSHFMSMMLDSANAHSAAKAAILRLIIALIKIQPSICVASQIPVYLGGYHGTLSDADVAALTIIFLHERNDVSLSEFKPLLWGSTAVSHYSVKKKEGSRGALWKVPKTSEVLSRIDPEKMIRTAIDFPLKLDLQPKADGGCGSGLDDAGRYDPRFFLPVFSQICSVGVYIDRHLLLVESGAMALAFRSLSSQDKSMRSAGYLVLARMYHQLESAKLAAEKKVWLHLIDIVRNGVRATKSANMETLRIPSLVTCFLGRACHVLRSPLDPMYKSVSGFVLAKPVLDLFKVPEFLRLFHGHEPGHGEERAWILAVIRDGLKNELDYSVTQKDFLGKLLLSYYDLANDSCKSLIRQILAKMVALKQPSYDLAKHHVGLLTWLLCQLSAKSSRPDRQATSELASIAFNAWESIAGDGTGKKDSEIASIPDAVVSEFVLLLDTLSHQCKISGDRDTLKKTLEILKQVLSKSNDNGGAGMVSDRDLFMYSQ